MGCGDGVGGPDENLHGQTSEPMMQSWADGPVLPGKRQPLPQPFPIASAVKQGLQVKRLSFWVL